ncbi:hypothetical protein CR513_58220, partial [Mucuna pruriens]
MIRMQARHPLAIRGLAPDGTPLLSSNSALPFLEILLRGVADLVKLNKPPAIPRKPELQNISRSSSTERAPMSHVNLNHLLRMTLLLVSLDTG